MTMSERQTRKRRVNKSALITILMMVVLCIAGFAYQEKINTSGNETMMVEDSQPSYNQETDTDATKVYLTTTDLNVRQDPNIEGKLLGTIDSGVSVTVDVVDDADWGYVREFKGYVSMQYLDKVPEDNVIGVVYTKNDTDPYLLSEPNETCMAEEINDYRTYLIRPILYNSEYYKVGTNAFIRKDKVVTEYYDKGYYDHFIKQPTSRGFTEYKPPKVFHKYINMNISEPSNLTVEEIGVITNGTPFEGTAPALKKIDEQGVNAIFAISVAMLESGNGTSYLARAQNNIFGLDPYNGGMSFSTKSECVEYFGRLMKKHYFANGRNTLYDINQMYEPYNSDWSVLVNNIMNENRAKLHR